MCLMYFEIRFPMKEGLGGVETRGLLRTGMPIHSEAELMLKENEIN